MIEVMRVVDYVLAFWQWYNFPRIRALEKQIP